MKIRRIKLVFAYMFKMHKYLFEFLFRFSLYKTYSIAICKIELTEESFEEVHIISFGFFVCYDFLQTLCNNNEMLIRQFEHRSFFACQCEEILLLFHSIHFTWQVFQLEQRITNVKLFHLFSRFFFLLSVLHEST